MPEFFLIFMKLKINFCLNFCLQIFIITENHAKVNQRILDTREKVCRWNSKTVLQLLVEREMQHLIQLYVIDFVIFPVQHRQFYFILFYFLVLSLSLACMRKIKLIWAKQQYTQQRGRDSMYLLKHAMIRLRKCDTSWYKKNSHVIKNSIMVGQIINL